MRRGSRYNGIILDPPAYGRGANGEKWILEENICEMLACCAQLLEPQGAFLVLNLYSMGLSSSLARTAVGGDQRWGCIGTFIAVLGLLCLGVFLFLLLAGAAVVAVV